MNSKEFEFIAFPDADRYRSLLRALEELAASGSLVLRDGLGLEASGHAFLAELTPWIVSRERGSEWPGTELSEVAAEIIRFRLDPVSMELLLRPVESLYAWEQPQFPEDLCLYRGDGSVVLATIAHERDAFVLLTSEEAMAVEPETRGLLRLRQVPPACARASDSSGGSRGR